MRIVLHDVPEDRAATDLDHRLWTQLGFLGEPGTLTAGEDHDFHPRHYACRRLHLRVAIWGMSTHPREVLAWLWFVFMLGRDTGLQEQRWSTPSHIFSRDGAATGGISRDGATE